MREHWDRWGWIPAMIIIAIGFLRVVWGREPFCGPESEHCAREWVSALGGWAALAAAVPTVFFLSRQILAADQHHKTTTALQLYRNRALAHHIKNYSTVLLIQFEANNVTKSHINVKQAHDFIELVEKLLTDGQFRSFESEIDAGSFSLALIKVQIATLKAMLFRAITEKQFEDAVMNKYEEFMVNLKNYLVNTSSAADVYLKRTANYAAKIMEDTHPANASSSERDWKRYD